MIISLNWLKKYTDIVLPVDELAERIGARLVEIESVTSLAEKYQDVVVVKVVECSEVPDSDHLSLTKIDDGGLVKDVERDAAGLVQVVCGAPNVRAGMMAAWLPPASTVPETFGTAEPFVLGARELRGHMSNGMLASAKELDLFDDHSGIVEIDKDATPGTSFARLYELDDYLFDIENKSLTHRPDAFGVIGFAREVAAIQGLDFKTPEWLQQVAHADPADTSVEAPKVIIDDPALSDRFAVVVLTGANEAALSPLEMQTYLSRSGIRPISAVVDVTNYLMLLTGQPLHAYDYDAFLKVSGGVNEIHVRSGRDGETLTLLDGRVLTLDEADMVIAAGDVPVGLAGAMGGAETEVTPATTRILLECGTFDLFTLRAIQMKHGVFTEAITRLTKGVPAQIGIPTLAEAVRLMGNYAGATQASAVSEAYPGRHDEAAVTVSVAHANAVLGTHHTEADMVATLGRAELSATAHDGMITVTVPYWRHDLSIAEDIIEEIGRLNGFDEITPTLPLRDFTAVRPSRFDDVRRIMRDSLVRAGANEVLTYSFVHGDLMKKAGQDPIDAYRIVNSISPELQYYRQSLTPSLLNIIHANAKAGSEHFAVFELNKFHNKRHELTEEGVPREFDSLAFVVARRKKVQGAAFYEAKQYLEYLAGRLGIQLDYVPLESDSTYPVTQPFEPQRSARVSSNGQQLGVIGEYRRSVAKGFKLPEYVAGFEVAPRVLQALADAQPAGYVPLSRYPGVERDICFKVADGVSYQQLYTATTAAAERSGVDVRVAPLDFYQPEDKLTKNITLRISFVAQDRTLRGEEVNEFMNSISKAVTAETKGTVI